MLILLLAPLSTAAAQSPELVQAKARLKALNTQMNKLDETIEQELEATLARQVDTAPKGEFETTTEYQARLAAAKETRQRLEPEFERKKADRRQAIQQEIETLTSTPYPAPIRIRLGTYDADRQAFPFFVRATGDSGTIEIPREVAPDIKTNLPTLKQTGWWRLLSDGEERLAVVGVEHQSGTYGGTVNIGLYLQGGFHLILEVDISTLVRNLAENKDSRFKEVLVRTGEEAETTDADFFTIFRQNTEETNLRLIRYFSSYGTKVPDIIAALRSEADDAVNRVLEIIRNRVDQFGVSEPTIQKAGGRRIIVEMTGIKDPVQARNLIQNTALLEFNLLQDLTVARDVMLKIDEALGSSGASAELVAGDTTVAPRGITVSQEVLGEHPFTGYIYAAGNDLVVPARYRYAVESLLARPEVQATIPNDGIFLWSNRTETLPVTGTNEEFYCLYYLYREPGLTGSVITEARANIGAMGSTAANQPVVNVAMNNEGSRTWARLTGANVGRRVAVVLDKKVHTTPVIQGKISSGEMEITGMGSMDEAKIIAIVLRAGALPAPVDIIEERFIDTSLGQDSIQRVLLAAIRSGAGGAVSAKGSSLPPALSASVTFTEPSGDNILAANEEGTLAVTLTNRGQGPAYGVEVALTLRQAQGDVSGQAPGFSFPARRYLGEIPPGKSQTVTIPLKAGLDIPDGQTTLTCTFTEANGFEPDPVEITFETRAYRPPQLAVADVGVDEPSGNGMIEPGEVVTVMVRVQNRGMGAAEQAAARVNIGQNVFAAAGSQTEFDLGTLPPGEYQDIQFQIYTNRRAREIPVSVTLTERHGRYGLADAPLELPFNQPVRSIQQVVVEGKAGEVAVAGAVAGGLSVDIERDIPQGRDRHKDAVALIIANRRYLDPDVPDVTFAHRDGEFVKQYLVRTLGYREGNIFLYQDATLSNFRTALQKLRNAARRGSDVFVYYTGHGAPDPDEKAGYFVPVDCDPNYVKVGGVALDEFYRELGGIRAGSVTVVIDACFSGASEAGMLIKEASPVFISVEDPTAGLKAGVVLTSASGDQISSWYSERNHSLYTYYFLKGLQGAADTNGDKSLTVGELQAYLQEQVPYMARRLHNRQQTPTVTPGSEERVLVRYE